MRPHLIAQRLNNSAALCIETGHYDRAVASLVEALKLSDHSTASAACDCTVIICQCRSCSLDECIVFSETTPLLPQQGHIQGGTECVDDGDNDDDGYTHRRPIRVTPRSLQEGHDMGVTLSLIITFNIALAHHLSAVSEATISRDKMRKILQLYELAYKWQIELDQSSSSSIAALSRQQHDDEDRNTYLRIVNQHTHHHHIVESSMVTSLRFNMIICNNLSQIHRLVNNTTKSNRCLQHLLSAVMFVVDTTATNGVDAGQQRTMELDGYLLNATPLILQGQSAGAA